MKYIITILASIFIAGCGITPQGNFVRDAVRLKGAQVNDAGLRNSLWFLCNGASIGSVQRMFGQSVATAELYKQMCKGQLDANVLGVKPNASSK